MSKFCLLFLIIICPLQQNLSQVFGKEFFNHNSLTSSDLILYNEFSTCFNIVSKENYTIIDSIITHNTSGSRNKLSFSYNEKGQIASFVIFNFENNLWVNSQRVTYTYDSFNFLYSYLYELWEGDNWGFAIMEHYENDPSGNIISKVIQLWDGNNWINNLQISNGYNPDGKLETSLTSKWNDGYWVNSSRLSIEYSANNLQLSNIFETWVNENWENQFTTSFQYDDKSRLISSLSKIWKETLWNNYVQININYDSVKSQTEGLFQVWSNNQWVNYERYSYSYTPDNYFYYGLYEYWQNGQWFPVDGAIEINNPDGFELHYLTHEIFVYYKGITDIERENSTFSNYLLFQNYPNPFNSSTTIRYYIPHQSKVSIKVYDILGNEIGILVNDTKVSGTYEIVFNGEKYTSGVYFYTLSVTGINGTFNKTKKILLLK